MEIILMIGICLMLLTAFIALMLGVFSEKSQTTRSVDLAMNDNNDMQIAFEAYIQDVYDNCPDRDEVSFEFFVANLTIEELQQLWQGACTWQLNLKEKKMSQLGDEPAYPIPSGGVVYHGLTKREHIAALQMQALIIRHGFHSEKDTAKDALILTDALLTRLSHEEQKKWKN